jgi:thermitase
MKSTSFNFWFGLAILASVLSACGNEIPPEPVNAYAVTVNVTPNDTVADLETRYQAKAEVFRPESGFAVLSSNTPVQGAGILAVESNVNALTAPEANVNASGIGAWSSGSGTWSSGWNAWISGWNAWISGNSVPSLPVENTALFNSIGLPQAHALSRKFGQGIKVAVIDTGVDLQHPGIKDRLTNPSEWKDFVDNDKIPQDEPGKGSKPGKAYGHGTAVAGIILQVAPKATILPLRVLTPNGGGDLTNVIKAIDYAIERGALIINLSLGSNISDLALSSELTYAKSKGVYVIASAGNNGLLDKADFPARLSFVDDVMTSTAGSTFGIGSVDKFDQLSNFTARGNGVFAFAPGEQIYTFYPNNQVSYVSGTSFSVPLVSGAFALAASELPNQAGQLKLGSVFQRSLESSRIWERYFKPITPAPDWTHSKGVLDVQRMILNLPGWNMPLSISQGNLASNPGFETGDLSDWLVKDAQIVQTNTKTGLYALKFLPTTLQFAEGKLSGLKPNTTYTLIAWVKSVAPNANVCIVAYDFTFTPIVEVSSYQCSKSQDYQSVSTRFTTDATHTTATFNANYGSRDEPQTVVLTETYIDDFMVIETPSN